MKQNQTKSDDAAIRAIAEKASPGWKAVGIARSEASVDAEAPLADAQGLDLSALRSKYLDLATDSAPAAAFRRNDDAHFVTMRPTNAVGSPIRTRKVIVSGNEAVGFEG